MNKKVLFGVFGLAGSLFAADNAVSSFNPYAAVKGGYSMLSKKDSVKYKNGFVGAAELGVAYDAWRLGLEVSYRKNRIKDSKTDNKAVKGQYNRVNVLAGMINVYYDYALTDECSLYAGAGVGAAKVAFAKQNKLEDSKTVFAWQVMAGLAYDINENWVVEAGYRLFNTNKVQVRLSTVNNNNNIVNNAKKVRAPFASSVELGLRYNF